MADVLTPLEQLYAFPTMMKWRGTWVDTEQYLKNDVVISPINSSSYILANETASLVPTDPSLDPNWEELSPATVGVTSVNAGAGISIIDPTGPNVVVSNDGVITLTQGTNININNLDPKNPIISATTPTLTTVTIATTISALNFPVAPTNVGTLIFPPATPTNIFYSYFQNGAPELTGIFNIDLTSINIFLNDSVAVGANENIVVLMIDSTNPSAPIALNIGSIELYQGATYPFQLRPSSYVVNVAAARAANFRVPFQFSFLNNTQAILEVTCWGDISATYYPEGLN